MVHRQCPPPPPGHRCIRRGDHVWGVFLAGPELGLKLRRAVLEGLLHGDTDAFEIEYCTPEAQPDIHAWAIKVAHALVPTAFPIFARGRWLKSVGALQTAGLLANVHGLMQRAIPAWVRLLKGQKVDIAAVAAPDAIVEWQAEPGGGDVGAVAQAGVDPCAKAPGEDWSTFNDRQRGNATSFSQMPTVSADLTITIATLRPQAELMSQILYIASDRWSEEALADAHKNGGPVQSRLGLYHSGAVTDPFFDHLGRLLRSELE